MKKGIYVLTLMLVMGICTGCGEENTEVENSRVEEQTTTTSTTSIENRGFQLSNVTSSFIFIQFLCSVRKFSFVCWSARLLNLPQRLFSSVSHIVKSH